MLVVAIVVLTVLTAVSAAGASTRGRSPGYWSGPQGGAVLEEWPGGSSVELARLADLNLWWVCGTRQLFGTDEPFNTMSVGNLQAWIKWPLKGLNMAAALSREVAAARLNVDARYLSGSSMMEAPELVDMGVPSGWISVEELIGLASRVMGPDPETISSQAFIGSPCRSLEEALKTVFERTHD